MFQKQYTKFIGTPLVEQNTGRELGKVYDLVIDELTGKIEALWVKEGSSHGSNKIVSINDILDWKIKIYLNDADSIINPEEILRVRKILERGVPVYLNTVKTLSGKKLGKVIDFFFEPISGQILQIEVAKTFLGLPYNKRLIHFSDIFKITSEAVILNNNYKNMYLKTKEKKIMDLKEAV